MPFFDIAPGSIPTKNTFAALNAGSTPAAAGTLLHFGSFFFVFLPPHCVPLASVGGSKKKKKHKKKNHARSADAGGSAGGGVGSGDEG